LKSISARSISDPSSGPARISQRLAVDDRAQAHQFDPQIHRHLVIRAHQLAPEQRPETQVVTQRVLQPRWVFRTGLEAARGLDQRGRVQRPRESPVVTPIG